MKLLPSGPRRATRNSSGDAAGTGRSAASSTAGAACTVSDVDSDTSDTSDTNSNQLQAMATISDSAMEAIRFFFCFFFYSERCCLTFQNVQTCDRLPLWAIGKKDAC